MTNFKRDISVFGACGHVGLPLSLTFADIGMKVIGIDINKDSIKKIQNKIMPFFEEDAQDILNKVIDDKNFELTEDSSACKDTKYIIIVPGTPVDKDLNTDLSHVTSVIDSIIPNLKEGHTIVLRSTLAPNTTEYIKNYIEKNTNLIVGKDVFLAYAPERIIQSKAIKEIKTLPQIIGCNDDASYNEAKKLFDKISIKTIRLNYLEAELAKLFTNSYRYVNFALANEYFIMCTFLGANAYKIIDAVNDDYPRANISKIGFAKGPCLGKDTWLLLNSIPNMGTFNGVISSSYRVNEGLPSLIIDKIKNLTALKNKKVAVLGLSFKKDCDDTRDSLSMKLVHLLKSEFVNVATHDPYVDNKDIHKVLEDADVIIIATNHTFYKSIDFLKSAKKGAIIADIWNLTKKDSYLYRL